MSKQCQYIYGIVQEPQPRKFSCSGVGEAKVYTINYVDLAAVVSDIELDEIDPTRKNVLAHTIVQDELLKHYTVIPTGFGMIATSQDHVLKLLEKNQQSLSSELTRLSGKVEVELKVFWDQEAMLKKLQGENYEFAKLKAKMSSSSSPMEARNLMMEAGRLVERIALDWKARYAERVYAVLKGLAIEAKLNNPLGVKNILNASFLLNRTKEGDFRQEVYKLDSQYQGNVNFKYVGPLAPYNFVSLKLETEN